MITVGSSKNVSAIFCSINVVSSSYICNDINSIANPINFNVNWNVSLIIHGKRESEFAFVVGGSRHFTSFICKLEISCITRNDFYFFTFWSWVTIYLCSTSDSVFSSPILIPNSRISQIEIGHWIALAYTDILSISTNHINTINSSIRISNRYINMTTQVKEARTKCARFSDIANTCIDFIFTACSKFQSERITIVDRTSKFINISVIGAWRWAIIIRYVFYSINKVTIFVCNPYFYFLRFKRIRTSNTIASTFFIDYEVYGYSIASYNISHSLTTVNFNATIRCARLRESSSWNEGQHECCHGSQRYNLLRDLIQLYSLPINFLRNLAPPQWGAGLFSLHPAWSVPHFSCRSRFATGKTSRQNKKPSAFAGLAARFRPVRPRPRQRLRPGLVESSRLGDMLWLYSPFR